MLSFRIIPRTPNIKDCDTFVVIKKEGIEVFFLAHLVVVSGVLLGDPDFLAVSSPPPDQTEEDQGQHQEGHVECDQD
jgi:hypothetical protein